MTKRQKRKKIESIDVYDRVRVKNAVLIFIVCTVMVYRLRTDDGMDDRGCRIWFSAVSSVTGFCELIFFGVDCGEWKIVSGFIRGGEREREREREKERDGELEKREVLEHVFFWSETIADDQFV